MQVNLNNTTGTSEIHGAHVRIPNGTKTNPEAFLDPDRRKLEQDRKLAREKTIQEAIDWTLEIERPDDIVKADLEMFRRAQTLELESSDLKKGLNRVRPFLFDYYLKSLGRNEAWLLGFQGIQEETVTQANLNELETLEKLNQYRHLLSLDQLAILDQAIASISGKKNQSKIFGEIYEGGEDAAVRAELIDQAFNELSLSALNSDLELAIRSWIENAKDPEGELSTNQVIAAMMRLSSRAKTHPQHLNRSTLNQYLMAIDAVFIKMVTKLEAELKPSSTTVEEAAAPIGADAETQASNLAEEEEPADELPNNVIPFPRRIETTRPSSVRTWVGAAAAAVLLGFAATYSANDSYSSTESEGPKIVGIAANSPNLAENYAHLSQASTPESTNIRPTIYETVHSTVASMALPPNEAAKATAEITNDLVVSVASKLPEIGKKTSASDYLELVDTFKQWGPDLNGVESYGGYRAVILSYEASLNGEAPSIDGLTDHTYSNFGTKVGDLLVGNIGLIPEFSSDPEGAKAVSLDISGNFVAVMNDPTDAPDWNPALSRTKEAKAAEVQVEASSKIPVAPYIEFEDPTELIEPLHVKAKSSSAQTVDGKEEFKEAAKESPKPEEKVQEPSMEQRVKGWFNSAVKKVRGWFS